jgi:hypothetical protein
MSVLTPAKSPKHTKEYYSDYITAEDRQGEAPAQLSTPPETVTPEA